MARPQDLMGIGVGPLEAVRSGTDTISVQSGGTSVGSALSLPPRQCIAYVNASNGGSGLLLPQITGDNTGILPSDIITVVNNLTANVAVYCANNSLGSVVSLIGAGANITGTTGVSVASQHIANFQALTVSTYVYIKSSA